MKWLVILLLIGSAALGLGAYLTGAFGNIPGQLPFGLDWLAAVVVALGVLLFLWGMIQFGREKSGGALVMILGVAVSVIGWGWHMSQACAAPNFTTLAPGQSVTFVRKGECPNFLWQRMPSGPTVRLEVIHTKNQKTTVDWEPGNKPGPTVEKQPLAFTVTNPAGSGDDVQVRPLYDR